MNPASPHLWALRILFVGGLGILPAAMFDSPIPSLAFALTWGPNGAFLVAFMRGVLRLPRVLVRVRPIEPILYRFLGVGLVKRIVETQTWALMNFQEPPPKPKNRSELLNRIELATIGAEVCHGATFIVALLVMLFCLITGLLPAAAWILGYNMLLNGYPVMLQRANRWRVQRVGASMGERSASAA